jgi:hypothetical protein
MNNLKLYCANLNQLRPIQKQLYYELYDEYSRIITEHNPCEFKGNTCILNRENGTSNGCCGSCDKLSIAGCKIEALGCRAFLCEMAVFNLPEVAKKRWRELNEIKEKYLRLGTKDTIKDL